MNQHFTGLVAATFAPMNRNGSVNLKGVDKLAASLVTNGVKAAFVNGSTGESLSLTVEEREQIAARWMKVAGKDVDVIVHVGHTSLPECRRLAAHAQRIGARAISALAPCFFKPATVDDLVAFCAEVAAAAPRLPFYYYNIPSMTGVNLPVAAFLRAAAKRIPTLAGAKFTHENLMDFTECLRLDGGRYDLLFGRDEMLLSALTTGARGAVGTTYSFAAPLYQRIIAAFEAGDFATAQRDQARAVEMIRVFICHGGLPAGKAMMAMIGCDCGPARLPLRALSAAQCARLRADLKRIGYFDYCSREP